MALAGCGGGSVTVGAGASIHLTSSAIRAGGPIPRRFTCDGGDVSPPLSWSGVPTAAAQLAITMEDLDAAGGSFTHWALGGLSRSSTGVDENSTPAGTVAGRNDFGRVGYGGPCPPRGRRHRYRFVVYALRDPLAVSPGFRLSSEGTALAKDTIAVGQMTAVYRR